MSKSKMKKIIIGIAFFISLIFNLKLIYYIEKMRDRVYSFIIKRELKGCGTNFSVRMKTYLKGGNYITIGNNFKAMNELRIEALHRNVELPIIKIGNSVSIQQYCHIGAINRIVIGDNVLIASKVFITDHSHGDLSKREIEKPPAIRTIISKGSVIIKNNVWIGEGVTILPNVTIGECSIIGANAVVTHDVPDYVVVAGNPANIIKRIEMGE